MAEGEPNRDSLSLRERFKELWRGVGYIGISDRPDAATPDPLGLDPEGFTRGINESIQQIANDARNQQTEE